MKEPLIICSVLFILLTGSSYAQLTHFEVPGYDYLPISGLGNWTVAYNDIDNDGDLDLFIGRSFQQDILLENDGSGHFTEIADPGNWQTPGGSFDALFIDLNNDNLKDLVIARGPESGGTNLLPGQDQVLVNNGDRTFTDVTANLPNVPVDDINFSMGVGKGDFNNDGIIDLVFVNGGINYLPNIFYFPSLGSAAFAAGILTGADGLGQILRNDLYFGQPDSDGDGIINFTDNSMSSGLGIISDMSTDVAVADFNGDGLDDIFVANFYDQSVNTLFLLGLQLNDTAYFSKLYINDFSNPGTFTWDQNAFPLIKRPSTSVSAADFDNDGDIDLLITNEKRASGADTSETVRIYINNGSGSFTDETTTRLPWLENIYRSGYDGHFAYLDNDSLLDIFVAGHNSFMLYQNPGGNGNFIDAIGNLPLQAASGYTHTFQSYGAAIGDFDGNGKNDIVLADTYEQIRLQLQINNGKFIDTTTTNLPPDGQNTVYAAIANLNHDRKPDIVKVNYQETSTHALYLYNSNINAYSYFTDHAELIPLPANIQFTRGVSTADIDNDGNIDIMITGEEGGYLFKNDGSTLPVFTNNNTTWLNGFDTITNIYRAKFADINGDGHSDIFLPRGKPDNSAIAEPNMLFIWDNNQNKFINQSSWLPPNNAISLDVDFADLNNDGMMDFIVANTNQAGSLYMSDTTGVYSIFRPFSAFNSYAVKFADFDGDGYIDIVETSKDETSPLKVHFNNGTFNGAQPEFAGGLIIPGSEEPGEDVAVYDLNSDSYPDIILASFAENKIYMSNGVSRSFTDMTTTYFPQAVFRSHCFSKGITMGDLNGDGLIDIYFSRDNQDLLFYGQGTSLSIPEFPIPNNELQLNVYPNPFKKELTVSFVLTKAEKTTLIIYDITGGEIHREEFPGAIGENTKIINLQNISGGIYFLQLKQGKSISQFKIIKTE